MEFVILIVFGVGVWVIAASGARNRRDYSKPSERDSLAPRRDVPVAGRRPFNAKTARPISSKTVLVGRAYVVDGDTIAIRKTQIRLFGIDAPELSHPYGQKAKWELVALCNGKSVQAEIIEQDAHGRTVARCYLDDGRDLSAEMVKSGLAIDWPKFSGGQYSALEVAGARKKMWLADARQKGRMHVWERFEARQKTRGIGK